MKITTLEQAAQAGYTFRWEDDWDLPGGSHLQEYGETYADGEPTRCESLMLFDPEGDIVGSLGCIDDASDEYRRELELDMLSEIPEPDTYVTSMIDRLTPADFFRVQIRSDADGTHTKWFNVSPEELVAIRAILARRTV